jgi:hypothetical protein
LSSLIHPRARALACRVAALTCLGVLASAGVALADCPGQSLSTPFTQWGDSNSYFLVPGGDFNGTPDQIGWTLSGASLTPGGEPFDVDGSTQSVTISAGGAATSPYFCVDDTMSDLRFFAQEATGGSDLLVQALVQTPNGVQTVPVEDLADGSMPSWAPTQPVGDTSQLPDGDTVMVALQFSVPQSAGSWQIDDVYVDPYRSG